MKFTIPGEPTGKQKAWSEEEKQYLKDHYAFMTHEEMAITLGRTPNAVRNKCYDLRLRKKDDNWTDKEIEILKDYYIKDGETAPINMHKLEEVFGRDKTNICRKAKELGLPTNTHRKQSDETIKKYSEKAKKQIQEKGHPRGMAGKHHSQEFKSNMSERVKKEWADPKSTLNSEEHRQKKSDYMTMRQATNPLLRQGYSRGKQGKRKDLGDMYFRSAWEANYARYLNWLIGQGQICKWEYEPDTFWFENIKRGVRSYLPDFKIWDSENAEPYYDEVKGWMDDKSKTKLKRMAKYYPKVKINVIDRPVYREIEKAVSGFIKGWEK